LWDFIHNGLELWVIIKGCCWKHFQNKFT
jgi:hypothetical protein